MSICPIFTLEHGMEITVAKNFTERTWYKQNIVIKLEIGFMSLCWEDGVSGGDGQWKQTQSLTFPMQLLADFFEKLMSLIYNIKILTNIFPSGSDECTKMSYHVVKKLQKPVSKT